MQAMFEESQDRLGAHILDRLFVNRHCSYSTQRTNGHYSRVDQPLTLKVLERHLKGEITVGAYQLAKDDTVKYLCWDLDPEKLENPKETAKTIIIECVGKPTLKEPRFRKDNVALEASRYPDDSYHVWVFFQPPLNAKFVRWLGNKILQHAELSPRKVEIFPKQGQLTESCPYGNFVKLPLGFHQAKKKWSRLLDLTTMKAVDTVSLRQKSGCSFLERDERQLAQLTAKKQVLQMTIALPVKPIEVKGNQQQRIVALLSKYWEKGSRHDFLFSFLGWAVKKGIPYETTYLIVDAVTSATNDEEKQTRLDLVGYHYKNRRDLLPKLKGVTGLREVIRNITLKRESEK